MANKKRRNFNKQDSKIKSKKKKKENDNKQLTCKIA